MKYYLEDRKLYVTFIDTIDFVVPDKIKLDQSLFDTVILKDLPDNYIYNITIKNKSLIIESDKLEIRTLLIESNKPITPELDLIIDLSNSIISTFNLNIFTWFHRLSIKESNSSIKFLKTNSFYTSYFKNVEVFVNVCVYFSNYNIYLDLSSNRFFTSINNSDYYRFCDPPKELIDSLTNLIAQYI